MPKNPAYNKIILKKLMKDIKPVSAKEFDNLIAQYKKLSGEADYRYIEDVKRFILCLLMKIKLPLHPRLQIR